MRHFNIDWPALIERLVYWHALSVPSKLTLLELKQNVHISNSDLAESDRETLVTAGILQHDTSGKRVRWTHEARELSKAVRAMKRHAFHPYSDERDLDSYVSEHFTTQESVDLFAAASSPSYGFSRRYVQYRVDAATVPAWPQQLCAMPSAKAALTWENKHVSKNTGSDRTADGSPYFGDPELFAATKKLLKAAHTWPQPVPLIELHKQVPDVPSVLLSRAIMPAIRYMMLFAWLDENLNPVISLWPYISHMLHRKEPPPAQPVEPEQTHHACLLEQDIVTVLVAAAASPIKMLADRHGAYARDLDRMALSSTHPPDWTLGADDSQEEFGKRPTGNEQVHGRFNATIDFCLASGLLETLNPSKRREAVISEPGRQWLAMDVMDRIRWLIDPWRPKPPESKKTKAERRTASRSIRVAGMSVRWDDPDSSPWMPQTSYWGNQSHKVDWRAAFEDMLHDADGHFVPLADLVNYHTCVNNPLLGKRKQGTYGPAVSMVTYGGAALNELEMENLWTHAAAGMIHGPLASLGAVEVGIYRGEYAIRLHSIGKYMLGLADDFEYHTTPDGAIIIQPNFDVTFMGPSPRAEATLAPLAERIGSNIGTIFRITRKSILAAAAAGITEKQALADLSAIVSKPIPDNVQREMRGWFALTRHVRMRRTWLIDAPDEQTATQISATAGKLATLLTPTLVEVSGQPKDHTALKAKLKAAGIFVR